MSKSVGKFMMRGRPSANGWVKIKKIQPDNAFWSKVAALEKPRGHFKEYGDFFMVHIDETGSPFDARVLPTIETMRHRYLRVGSGKASTPTEVAAWWVDNCMLTDESAAGLMLVQMKLCSFEARAQRCV
jgi:hypothetical protein